MLVSIPQGQHCGESASCWLKKMVSIGRIAFHSDEISSPVFLESDPDQKAGTILPLDSE